MDAAILIKAIELAAKYGLPAIVEGIKAMNKDTITLADVEALDGLVKRPETFFSEPDEAA